MTPAEAFRELGIDRGATADEIRRAYLRGVKTRKPEVDPEGFRRWREAYELLSAGGASPGRETPSPAARPAGEERTAPKAPEAAQGFPSLLTPEEMERLGESADPGTLTTLAEAHARRGDSAAASALLQRAFNLADVQGDLANPSPWRVIQILLLLQSQGALAASRTLFEQLYWRLASGRVKEVFSGEQAALWALVRELHELSPAFHQGARKAIADAILEGDPSQAARQVWEVARRCGEQNRRYAAMLQPLPILGPLFHEIFLRALSAQKPPAVPPPLPASNRQAPHRPAPRMRLFGSTIDSRAVYILLAVFFVLGLIGTAMDNSSAPPRQPAAPSLGGRAESAAPLLAALRAACPRDRLTADIVGACQQARTAFDALRDTQPDCTAAKAALFFMRANGIPQQGPLSDLARQLSTLYHQRCPGP